jgi:phage terminase large subunit-like protein
MHRLSDVARIDGRLPTMIVAEWLNRLGIEETHRRIDEMLDQMSVVELAAHCYDWRGFWARPKQVLPADAWESCGYLSGRGNGKTVSLSNWVNEEVEAERAPLVCLIAQDEASSIQLHVTGPSGLIATSKPWFRPVWHASALELHWPNGAVAYVRTPEVPGKIRGLEYHLTWASELQSWPAVTMNEAWMNVEISTRLGLSRIVWDATAKRRHQLLTRLLKDGERHPEKHRVVRGSTYENVLNLGRGYIEKIERKYAGTRQGEEELFARMFDDAEGATVTAEVLKMARGPRPERLLRRVLGLDVAVTKRDGSDSTGIIDAGLSVDRRCAILGDYSGKHTPEAWATIVLDRYSAGGCDCVVVETNKGGDLVTQNLRAAARERGVSVVVLGKDEKPRHVPSVLYVREVYARGEKADRAKPLSTAYERGLVYHVDGVPLVELEEILTTWIPTPGSRSPDRLDAEVHAATEILGLSGDDVGAAAAAAFVGIQKLAEAIAAPASPVGPAGAAPSRGIAALLSHGRGGRI